MRDEVWIETRDLACRQSRPHMLGVKVRRSPVDDPLKGWTKCRIGKREIEKAFILIKESR